MEARYQMIDRSKWYVCYRDDTTPLTWINGKAIVFPSEDEEEDDYDDE